MVLGAFGVDSWQDVAAIATIGGILVAVSQLAAHAGLARSSFEDTFAKEYRAIIKAIPTKALLGAKLTPEERTMTLDDFYHYIDLCNEQAYLKRRGRISGRTWQEWSAGIKGNLNKPEFRRAWSYIAHYAKDDKGQPEFESLRKLVPPDAYDEAHPYLRSAAP